MGMRHHKEVPNSADDPVYFANEHCFISNHGICEPVNMVGDEQDILTTSKHMAVEYDTGNSLNVVFPPLIIRAFHDAVFTPNSTVVIATPTAKLARLYLDTIVRDLFATGPAAVIGCDVRLSQNQIRFENGSHIRFVRQDPTRIRGLRVDTLILVSLDRCPDLYEIYCAMVPSASPGGTVIAHTNHRTMEFDQWFNTDMFTQLDL